MEDTANVKTSQPIVTVLDIMFRYFDKTIPLFQTFAAFFSFLLHTLHAVLSKFPYKLVHYSNTYICRQYFLCISVLSANQIANSLQLSTKLECESVNVMFDISLISQWIKETR